MPQTAASFLMLVGMLEAVDLKLILRKHSITITLIFPLSAQNVTLLPIIHYIGPDISLANLLSLYLEH